jgi:nucleotide-binding universal stress UspA family protein
MRIEGTGRNAGATRPGAQTMSACAPGSRGVVMIERILVPTDMTEFSELALRYALLFNERLGSKITLLHADEISWFAAEHPLGYYFENVPETKLALTKSLAEYAAANVPPDVGVITVFEDDTPERAIVATAREIDADLIIMGTHGRHGLQRVLLGSITERVLHTTNIPVISVAPAIFPHDPDLRIRTVLCPVNFTRIARTALEQACAMAESFEAELVLVHVVEGAEPHLFSAVEAEFRTWVSPFIRANTRYKEIVVHGDAAESVLVVADQIDADLIVIGAQHRFFSDTTVVGTTTERITRFARHPVMTVILPPVKAQRAAVA